MFSKDEKIKIRKFTLKRANLSFGKIFKKQRTILDVDSKDINSFIEPDVEIKNVLRHNHYSILDYTKGLATKDNDSNKKNVYKIGKILRKIEREDLLTTFEQRTHGTILKNLDKFKYKIVVTYNPFDVAGMSTDKNWTSCTNIREGCKCETAFNSIKYGNMVAYLVKEEDINKLNNALARIIIKRFYLKGDKKKFVFLAEKRSYGDNELAERVKMPQILDKKLDEHNKDLLKCNKVYLRADKDDYSDTYGVSFTYLSSLDMIRKCIIERYDYSGEKRENLIINDDNSLTINGDFTLGSFYEYYSPLIKNGRFTVKFKQINGDFTVSSTGLEHFDGCPEVIKGNFNCSWNNIYSLENCPKKVENNFYITNNVKKFSVKEIKVKCKVKQCIYCDK